MSSSIIPYPSFALDEFLPARSNPATLPLIEDDPLVGILENASRFELDGLVRCLIEKGKFTCQLKNLPVFKENFPKHRAYSKDIAAEIQKYGGNTLANQLFRSGKGVAYSEIVGDVAKKLGLRPTYNTAKTELLILDKLLAEFWRGLTVVEQQELLRQLDISGSTITKSLAAAGTIELTRLSAFSAYKATVILANAVTKALLGHGLTLATNAALTKGLSVLLGPPGWVVAGCIGAVVAGSPAYRVTVPCVLQIAVMRQAVALRETPQQKIKRKLKLALPYAAAILALATIIYLIAH